MPEPQYSELLVSALEHAARWHAPQVRKGTTIPYLSHPLLVCSLVLDDGGSEVEACAALLHDAVEDTEATPDDVERLFGREVRRIVDACSDADSAGDGKPKQPWWPRKRAHFEHLVEHGLVDPSVARVMAADKLANLTSQLADHRRRGEVTWDRFKGGLAGTLRYVETAAGLVTPKLVDGSPLFTDLMSAVDALRAIREEVRGRFDGVDVRIAAALGAVEGSRLQGCDEQSIPLVAYEIARRATRPSPESGSDGTGVAIVHSAPSLPDPRVAAVEVLTSWFDRPAEPAVRATIDQIVAEVVQRLDSATDD